MIKIVVPTTTNKIVLFDYHLPWHSLRPRCKFKHAHHFKTCFSVRLRTVRPDRYLHVILRIVAVLLLRYLHSALSSRLPAALLLVPQEDKNKSSLYWQVFLLRYEVEVEWSGVLSTDYPYFTLLKSLINWKLTVTRTTVSHDLSIRDNHIILTLFVGKLYITF